MKNIFPLFLLLTLSLLMCQCESPTKKNDDGLISRWVDGFVIDTLTNKPIFNAQVFERVWWPDSFSTGIDTAYTDSSGYYVLFLGTGCGPNDSLQIEKEGYYTKRKKCYEAWTHFDTARVDVFLVSKP